MSAPGVAIAVAGSVNMDLVFRSARLPLPGETVMGSAFHQYPGGKGANQAVACARQGAQVSMIGRVGADAAGASLRAALGADGIGLAHLATSEGAASGIAAILVDDAGANSIVLAPGANLLVTPADIEAARTAIAQADMLVCQLEMALPAVLRAMDLARAAGRAVLFNPAPVQALPDEVLARADYLVVNESEAALLSGLEVDSPATAALACAALHARGAAVVLVTLGAQGVVLGGAGGNAFLPAIAVQAVDSTAAGDTFIGAFAVALLEGADVLAAASRAQYAAALTVTRPGAQESIPTKAEVERFIAAHA